MASDNKMQISLQAVMYSPRFTERNVALKLWSLQCLSSLISRGAVSCRDSLKEFKPREKRFLNVDYSLKMWKEGLSHGPKGEHLLSSGLRV